ncbi:hypothetical protein CXB51_003131 [Gossypium anomalum]|uniref:RNase H type-1 domain-containing protein n=1 Tax=Gossypium anomalum TaxID=47600 RepID=A0A8J6DBF5_9ROSI|nr:hypothetical protein CXB51_003131 [Gossypium anomalum]
MFKLSKCRVGKFTFTYLEEYLGSKGTSLKRTVLESGQRGNISIWDDSWIQGIDKVKGHNKLENEELQSVSDLIDFSNKKWKMNLIYNTFPVEIAQKILQIPLADTAHEDIEVWKGEPSGEFSVRSAYKLLQGVNSDPSNLLIQTEIKDFYRKLWGLQLPSKITITIWRISWDFIPNLANQRYKKVIVNNRCPRCRSWVEDSSHIFHQCPITTEVWQLLHLSWVMNNRNQNIWEWLTWVFKRGTAKQCRLFCIALWLIWFSRNQLIHERKPTTGRELAQRIQGYMAENEGVKETQIPLNTNKNHRDLEDIPRITIQFDTAFDNRNFKSAVGLVVCGLMGELLALKSTLHNNVSSPFAAEAFACLEGIKLGISMGIQSVKIMGDSRTIIKKGQTSSTDKSVIGAIIRDIQNKKSCFQEIIFQHIHRLGDSQAHKFAKNTLDRREISYLVGEELNRHTFGSEGRWSRSLD